MFLRRLIVLVVATAALSACTRYTLVDPTPQKVGSLTVEPNLAWNRISAGQPGDLDATALWTIDGESLHGLIFATGISPGDPLLGAKGVEDDLPTFRQDMTLHEVASGLEAAVTKIARTSIFTMHKLQPTTFLGKPGLRMEFSYTGHDEIDRDGLAIAAIIDNRLHMMLYHGTKLLHFDKYRNDVERIISTARLESKT